MVYEDLLFNDRATYGEELKELKIIDAENKPADGKYILWLAEKTKGMDPMLYEHYNALRLLFKGALSRYLAAFPERPVKDENVASAIRMMVAAKLLNAEKYLPMLVEKPESERLEADPAAGDTAAKYAIKVLLTDSRNATFELPNAGLYHTEKSYSIYLNGEFYSESDKVVESLYGLTPDTFYKLYILTDGVCTMAEFRTKEEFVTLNVKDFGALGDGVHDDTLAIQAAISCCPADSRIFIPDGKYRVTSLFLKSDITIELAKGATLIGCPDRDRLAILPGRTEAYDEQDEYLLGSWEGNPLNCFSAMITGVGVKNVTICGQGTLDGGANADNWWKNPKAYDRAWRPRLMFLCRCKDITLQGVTIQNSPSWNLHPTFSDNLKFIDLKIRNPKDSPNTDGLDPESCSNVQIVGVFFSVGDDCIAIKSGKIYMGSTYKTPCSNLDIRHCCMRDGHGSVTLGSEMAGGIMNLNVHDCEFIHTDRGLRIKTRRGRGKDAVISNILFDNIKMDNVSTPIVINEFYFCDPDGHSDYVQSKDYREPDDRLPYIGNLRFQNLDCVNCHAAGVYMFGLPEKKIGNVSFENVNISFSDDPVPGRPAMMDGAADVTRLGFFAKNVSELSIENISIEGYEGEKFRISDTDKVVIK